MSDTLIFDNPTEVAFSVDRETRTIRGLALPFGEIAIKKGRKWRFSANTEFDFTGAKFLNAHDWAQLIGVSALTPMTEGLDFAGAVAATPLGDQILSLAEMGALDGLSVGLGNDVRGVMNGDVFDVTFARVREVSTTPIPAFQSAAIRSVAASADTTEGEPMPENETTFAEATAVEALEAKVSELETSFSQLAEVKVPVTATLEVTEEPIYRFSGSETAASGHDFATDLLAAAKDGDMEALDRIKTFTAEVYGTPNFASTVDTAAVNPAVYRPDMFLGQAPTPTSPMYDTFHKGGLANITPFFYTKLDREATDVSVDDHTEGEDPEDSNLVTATGATVTPKPVSGKVHITREVGDQGGNPSVSALVWAEFDRSFKIALENKTAALIQAAMAEIEALTTIPNAADGVAVGEALELGLVDLQFRADGTRFTKGFGNVHLYRALASAKNADDEHVYPIINPQNRSGLAGSKYSFIDVAGYRIEPTHSLGPKSAASGNSIIADPTAVHVWNSGLTRLDKLQEKVEGWDVGVFGYFAGIVYDVTGLLKVAYKPTA